MDTREKIIDWSSVAELLKIGRWAVIPGLFDPLTATQAGRLAKLAQDGRKLLVIVDPDPERLLPVSARAALIASLRSVSAVTISEREKWQTLLSLRPDLELVDDEEGERRRSTEFVDFVRNRNQLGERRWEKVP